MRVKSFIGIITYLNLISKTLTHILNILLGINLFYPKVKILATIVLLLLILILLLLVLLIIIWLSLELISLIIHLRNISIIANALILVI